MIKIPLLSTVFMLLLSALEYHICELWSRYVRTYPSIILQQPVFLLLSQVVSYGLCQSSTMSRPLPLPKVQPRLLVFLLQHLSGQHPSKGEKGNDPPPVHVSVSHQLLHHFPEAGAGVRPALPQESLSEGVEASLVLCRHVLSQTSHGSGWLAGRWRGWPRACAAQGQVVLCQSQGVFPQPTRHFLPGRDKKTINYKMSNVVWGVRNKELTILELQLMITYSVMGVVNNMLQT